MTYCAVCDHWYRKGEFRHHRDTFAHVCALKHRRSMNKWYRSNGK